MTFPNLPLDNSFKFVFYLGLFLTVLSAYMVHEELQLKREKHLKIQKKLVSRRIDEDIKIHGAPMLLDTSLGTLKLRMLDIEMEQIEIKNSKDRVYEYIMVFVAGMVLCLLTIKGLNALEAKQNAKIDLELEILKLDYQKRLASSTAIRKYIRIK